MKRFFPVYIVVWLILTLVGGVSFVSAQTTPSSLYGTEIICPDWSLDPGCVAAKIAAEKIAYCKTSSSICWSPSAEMVMIIDFVREMMNSIKTIWTEWKHLGKYVDPNWFQWNEFVPPKQNIFSQVGKNLQQKAMFAVASAAIFTNPTNWGGIKDILGNTTLLAKDKVFLRDTKLVEELESQLSTKKLEVGLGGWWYSKINPANRAVMTNIIQKYDKKWLLSGNMSYIPDGVLYADVVSLLTQMLSSAKAFLAVGMTYQFTEVSRWWSNGIRIAFVDTIGASMKNEYACVTFCDINKKTFGALWSDLSSTVSEGIHSGFVLTIKDANSRFVQTFSKEADQTEQFKARQNDLLQSTYGTSQRRKGFFNKSINGFDELGEVADAVKDIGAGIVDAWKYVANKDFRTTTKEQKKVRKEAKLPTVASVSHYDTSEVAFENILRGYVSDVFEQQALDIELASFAETKEITHGFNALWLQIVNLKTKVVGNKTQEWTLVKALWDACEAQCANKKWTCRQ